MTYHPISIASYEKPQSVFHEESSCKDQNIKMGQNLDVYKRTNDESPLLDPQELTDLQLRALARDSKMKRQLQTCLDYEVQDVSYLHYYAKIGDENGVVRVVKEFKGQINAFKVRSNQTNSY